MADTAAAEHEVLIENDLVHVVRWKVRPGTAIGWHRHRFPYVVVPLAAARLTFRDAHGDRPVELVVGNATFRPSGTEHDVLNEGETTAVFVETEIKSGPAAT